MRAFKRERSQRWENREDAEGSQRLTVSWAKVKLLSMQRFKCCLVESFTDSTILPYTLSNYKIQLLVNQLSTYKSFAFC